MLMSSSLLLLLGFQLLWLHKEYQQGKKRLRERASEVFFDGIRELQDSLMSEIYKAPLFFRFGDSAEVEGGRRIGIFSLEGPGPEELERHAGRIRRMSFSQLSQVDSGMQLVLRSRMRYARDMKARPGSLSVFMALAADSSSLNFSDSLRLSGQARALLPLLEAAAGRGLAEKGISLPFEVLALSPSDSLPPGIHSRVYYDFPSNQMLLLNLPVYRAWLLQQITPQILFSLLLFSGIALAFFLIYQSLLRQQRLTRLKNDFISNVTHELKTPITTVGVALEALSNFQVLEEPAKTQEYLQISRHELDRLAILVDRVLKMALFEQGEPELKMEPLDMKELIQGILNSMKLQFERLTAQVNFQSFGSNFSTQGDRIHLTSVVYNLIDNALKYSNGRPEIRIDLEANGRQLKLSVQDQGMGIAREYQQKIFDKFFRIPAGDRHDIKGHGLGLSYVFSVVRKHQGSITVESEPGKGSCFTIFLPGNKD